MNERIILKLNNHWLDEKQYSFPGILSRFMLIHKIKADQLELFPSEYEDVKKNKFTLVFTKWTTNKEL